MAEEVIKVANEPKYEKIKKKLKVKIENNILPVGSELPSENELIEEYHVSRITVRRAFDELERDGYIEKKQGRRGCVKKRKKTQELNDISSYTEEILRQGMTPSRKVLLSDLFLCNSEELVTLELDKAQAVFRLERIIFADDLPLCYTLTSLPYKYFRDIENYDFEINSLYDTIENDYHVKITHSVINLKAVPAKKEIANYLQIPESFPLLQTGAITYGLVEGKEVPIEHFLSYYRTDLFEYKLTQQRHI